MLPAYLGRGEVTFKGLYDSWTSSLTLLFGSFESLCISTRDDKSDIFFGELKSEFFAKSAAGSGDYDDGSF